MSNKTYHVWDPDVDTAPGDISVSDQDHEGAACQWAALEWAALNCTAVPGDQYLVHVREHGAPDNDVMAVTVECTVSFDAVHCGPLEEDNLP